jgi:hypothetical protein
MDGEQPIRPGHAGERVDGKPRGTVQIAEHT